MAIIPPAELPSYVSNTIRRGKHRPFQHSADRRRFQRVRAELPPVGNSGVSHSTIARNEAEVRRRIEELKRPQPPEELENPVFHYDENEPLLLIRKADEEANQR